MKFILSIAMLFTCFMSGAKDYFVPVTAFRAADLTPMAPYIFIFNQKGELIFRSMGVEETFARAIHQNKVEANSEEIKGDLAKIIQLPDFSQHSFTIIYTLMQNECPPCQKQEKMFDDVLPRFAPATFDKKVITLTW